MPRTDEFSGIVKQADPSVFGHLVGELEPEATEV